MEDINYYAKYLTESMDCLVCGSKSNHPWAKKESYQAVQCDQCSFVWINPYPNAAGLDDFYNDYMGARDDMVEKAKLRKKQYDIDRDFVLDLFPKEQNIKILDVGCSDGSFLASFSDSFIKHGVDKDVEAVKKAKRQSFGNNILCVDISNASYEDNYFDIVIMRGVIEHLSNPDPYITKIKSILKDGGYLYICATPNVNSFCAHVYRDRWNQFIPPEHLLYFSDKTLEQYVSKYNFKIVKKDFPYTDTPYADLEKDYAAMIQECKTGDTGISRAFWGNMMSIVFQKVI